MLALVALLPGARAQIVRLDLARMLAKADDAVVAEIVGRRAFRAIEPASGEPLYFTALMLDGRSLIDGRAVSLEVLHLGGFVSEREGTHNSEAPSADDTRVGNRVIAFPRFVDDLGGGVSGHALYAMHGGLYRTADGPLGPVVLGRGEGYAVSKNLRLAELESAVRALRGGK
jgi:hypothetical protein